MPFKYSKTVNFPGFAHRLLNGEVIVTYLRKGDIGLVLELVLPDIRNACSQKATFGCGHFIFQGVDDLVVVRESECPRSGTGC